MRAILFLTMAALCAAQSVPRAEYPQPQFERPQWMTLNGPWEFEFDDTNAGLAQNWPESPKKFSRTITVPFAFTTESPSCASIHWIGAKRVHSLWTCQPSMYCLASCGSVSALQMASGEAST